MRLLAARILLSKIRISFHSLCVSAGNFGDTRFRFACSGRYRYILAATAHYPVFTALGCAVFPEFAAFVRMVAFAQTVGALYTEFQRKQSHTSQSQNNLRVAFVDYHFIQYHMGHQRHLDSRRIGRNHDRRYHPYTFFQDLALIGLDVIL